jgi:sugar phosphate isomerase/epimerase
MSAAAGAMYPSFNARALGLSLSAPETLEVAASAGFAGVDLLPRDMRTDGEDPIDVRARMDDLGLCGGTWALPVGWRGDADRFADDLAQLPKYAEAARILGLSATSTWVMPETPGRPAPGRDTASYLASVADLHVRRLGAIARVLARHGGRLGVEVIGVESFRAGCGLPFVTRLAELGRHLGVLLEEFPNVGILLDGYHLFAGGEDVEAGLAWGVGRVVGVHVADLPASAHADRRTMRDDDRGLPGENGAIDSRQLLRTLAGAGYTGPVTAEPMAGCRSLAGLTVEATARRVAAALRSVWPGQTR